MLIELAKRTDDESQAVSIFSDYLTSNNLTAYIPNIMRHLRHHQNQVADFNTLKVSSRYKLNEEFLSSLKKSLAIPADTPTSMTTNEKAVGGFVATYQGKQYDATLQTQVHNLHKALTQ